jgi:hypothetical protein
MSKYQERLLAHIEANPDFIQPSFRKNEVLALHMTRMYPPPHMTCMYPPHMAWPSFRKNEVLAKTPRAIP